MEFPRLKTLQQEIMYPPTLQKLALLYQIQYNLVLWDFFSGNKVI